MGEIAYYASTYKEAREKFRQLAAERGGTLVALPVNQRQELFIDIALWQGSSETLIIHVSGVHGVEAYPGSAVQCAFLDQWEFNQLGKHSLALIHCVNPFGMRYLRRWNANNIDLNRNFLENFDSLPSNPTYHQLDRLLNPQCESQLAGFTWQALRQLFRHRFSILQQAIAQGQYDDPEGLFFGGNYPATEAKLLLKFFSQYLYNYSRIRGIDFHTGLGKYQKSSFYLEVDSTPDQQKQAKALLKAPVIYASHGKAHSYRTYGSLISGLKRFYSSQDFLMLIQEIGTVGPIRILRALREENYYYHHKMGYQPEAAHQLKQAFCPKDAAWRTASVREGVRALNRLVDFYR